MLHVFLSALSLKGTRRRAFAALVCGLALLWRPVGGAEAVTLTKIVDSFDPVPDMPPGATFIVLPWAAPALAGTTLVFAAQDSGHAEALWSAKTDGSGLKRLVDTSSTIPGVGTLFGEVSPFRLSGKKAAFRGTDFAGHSGYYSLSANGGPLKKLADQDTPLPDAVGTFGLLIGHVGGSRDGFDFASHLVFHDVHSGGGGVYRLPPAGGAASIVGNGGGFICEAGYGFGGIGTYLLPSISGGKIALLVSNVFGQAAIYTAPRTGITGETDPCASPSLKANNVTRIASVNDAVPGDPGARNFDPYGFGRPAIDKRTVVFLGAACPSFPCDGQGIYSKIGAGGLNKLVDTYTAVPSGNGTFQNSQVNFSLAQYALGGKYVVFRGADADFRDGLYFVATSGGPITKILAVGDTLPDGRTIVGNGLRFHHAPVQIDSLNGKRVGFRMDFNDPVNGGGTGIYVATLP